MLFVCYLLKVDWVQFFEGNDLRQKQLMETTMNIKIKSINNLKVKLQKHE